MNENEEMRLRLAEISAELAEEGPDSPGYGHNPLSESEVISDEPLLQENPSRFVIFPISDHDVWAMYKKAEAKFWNSEEIDMVMDKPGWSALPQAEQQHLLRLLPTTCEVGQMCLDNLLNRFTQEVQSTEARMFFGNQIAMLNMHNEMFASILDTFLPGAATQAQLISDVKANTAAKAKIQWCQQWTDSSASFGLRLVAFATVQSIMHAGTFASFYKVRIFSD
jgi:ribonucleoside-diphosphate reductase subunit M2